MPTPTGRITVSQPEMQNVPGTLAAKLEMAMARGHIKPVKEQVVVSVPKVAGINPILAMQEYKASKPKPIDQVAKDIIAAGYHYDWSWSEIGDKLADAGYMLSDETIQEYYDEYVTSVGH